MPLKTYNEPLGLRRLFDEFSNPLQEDNFNYNFRSKIETTFYTFHAKRRNLDSDRLRFFDEFSNLLKEDTSTITSALTEELSLLGCTPNGEIWCGDVYCP